MALGPLRSSHPHSSSSALDRCLSDERPANRPLWDKGSRRQIQLPTLPPPHRDLPKPTSLVSAFLGIISTRSTGCAQSKIAHRILDAIERLRAIKPAAGERVHWQSFLLLDRRRARAAGIGIGCHASRSLGVGTSRSILRIVSSFRRLQPTRTLAAVATPLNWPCFLMPAALNSARSNSNAPRAATCSAAGTIRYWLRWSGRYQRSCACPGPRPVNGRQSAA